jgi:hypothetical protein
MENPFTFDDFLKYSRRHSATDEAALKACRGYMRKAMKALDDAGAPDEDGDGVPDALEVKAVDYHSLVEMVEDAILEAIDLDDDTPTALLPYRVSDESDDDEPNILVYDDYAILMAGPESYRVGYAIEAGAVALDAPATWARVEAEWRPVAGAAPYAEAEEMAQASTAEIKMLPDGRLLVPGIRYGGRDLVGDTFTKATDLGAARSFVGMPVYYDHAQRGIKSQIGHVSAYEATDQGIDFYVELDRNHKYKAAIERLYAEKALGGTTGALSHLVVREGGELKRWIVGELSVSPTPAEPRTLPSTKATAEAISEALTGAVDGELARRLAQTYYTLLAYRLRSRYPK